MKRRNAETGKMRRPIKRTKITEGMFGNSMLYLKFVMLWATVVIADYMLEFRFEFLWPFWMMLRSVYESIKYQGVALTMVFICLVFTSDMICYFLMPMPWMFIAASTYVWMQCVWYTVADKGLCLPTAALCCLVAYVEGTLRVDRSDALTRGLDLCKPLAVHCVGYPAMTLGDSSIKSFIVHRFKDLKQKQAKENDMFFHLMKDVLPTSNCDEMHDQNKQATKESKDPDKVPNGVDHNCRDTQTDHKHMNGNAVKVKKSSKEQNGVCPHEQASIHYKLERLEKHVAQQTALKERLSNGTVVHDSSEHKNSDKNSDHKNDQKQSDKHDQKNNDHRHCEHKINDQKSDYSQKCNNHKTDQKHSEQKHIDHKQSEHNVDHKHNEHKLIDPKQSELKHIDHKHNEHKNIDHKQSENKHSEHKNSEHKHSEHKHNEHKHNDHKHSEHKQNEHKQSEKHSEHKHNEHKQSEKYSEHKHNEHKQSEKYSEHKHNEHRHSEKHSEHKHNEYKHIDHKHNEHKHIDHKQSEHKHEYNSKGSAKSSKSDKKESMTLKEERKKNKHKEKDSDSHRSSEYAKEARDESTKENFKFNSYNSNKEKETLKEKELTAETVRLRAALAAAAGGEAAARRALAAARATERARDVARERLQRAHDVLQNRVATWRGGGGERASLERRLSDERRARASVELELQRLRAGECENEQCISRRNTMESEVATLRRDLQRMRERATKFSMDLSVANDQLQAHSAPPAALRERCGQLERALSSETRVKLELLSALGDAQRRLLVREGLLSKQEKEIEELKAQMLAVMPTNFMTSATATVSKLRLSDSSPLDPNASVYTPKQLCLDA